MSGGQNGVDPGFTARADQLERESHALGVPGLPVDEIVSAARWLESFSRGEENYGGLGPAGSEYLKEKMRFLLGVAETLATELGE